MVAAGRRVSIGRLRRGQRPPTLLSGSAPRWPAMARPLLALLVLALAAAGVRAQAYPDDNNYADEDYDYDGGECWLQCSRQFANAPLSALWICWDPFLGGILRLLLLS